MLQVQDTESAGWKLGFGTEGYKGKESAVLVAVTDSYCTGAWAAPVDKIIERYNKLIPILIVSVISQELQPAQFLSMEVRLCV